MAKIWTRTDGTRWPPLDVQFTTNRKLSNHYNSQELSVIKKQNKGIQKKNKSLQQSLDASISSIPATSPTRRISKGVQYEHHVSLSSTPIKQRISAASLSPAAVNLLNISSIKENSESRWAFFIAVN